MAKAKSTPKVTPTAPEKPAEEAPARMIPAAVVIGDIRGRLKKIDAGLHAVDSVLALVDEGDDWAHALGFATQAIRAEVSKVYNQLGEMILSGDGSALGIEKGGAR